MKIRNPFFVHPVAAETQKQKAAIDAYLQANPSDEWVSLGQIKTALGAEGVKVSREVLNEYARVHGTGTNDQ